MFCLERRGGVSESVGEMLLLSRLRVMLLLRLRVMLIVDVKCEVKNKSVE